MRSIWSLTIDDYLEVVRRSKTKGLKPGDSMEKILMEYMKEKNQKPIGHTELTTDEFITEHSSKSEKGVLHQQVDKNGKATYRIIKKRGINNA